MHEVAISFTAEVTRAYEHNGSYALSLKIDDGSKYGGRAECWSDLPVSVGDTVRVTSATMPYAKTREYTDRDGNPKTATDLVYRDVRITAEERAKSAAEHMAEADSEIPF